MEKATLNELLSSKYNRDRWIDILKVVFKSGNVFAKPQPADLPQKEKWKQAYQLGSFSTADSYRLAVFEIEVADNIDLDRNRVSLRNLLNKYYKQTDGIFAVFIQRDRWRFSFVSQTEDYDEQNEEWIKSETEPKRYTYVLGEGEAVKTAADRFYKLVEETNISFEDIQEAFSVEKLNKEFYNKVVRFFYQLIGAKESGRSGTQHPHLLDLPGVPKKEKQTHQEFAVRLIGRTVFCWFLKYKKSEQDNPIVPKKALSSENIPNNYYHEFLEKLFFQVMNTPLDERRDDIPEILQEIPFLNGGLFEPHRQDFYKLDEGTGLSKNLNTLKIPDEWFKEFYAVLEQYNFTIDENSVEDADVSVDPEMLGRIFENLLAEIDPATGKTARKATGSYYTPREIVDYMVDESLTKYLTRKTGVNEGRLLPLLKFDTEVKKDISLEESTAIIGALNELKILDPACGSGAFPMGILQKMVRILEKVDPKSEFWKDLQLRKIPSVAVRRILRQKLDSATVEYARKLGIIQHSIYGVDIQPIAAEISKLRCFLSLVVDEKVDETEDNWAIDPLPNLEFKFVTANSLIALPREDSVTIDMFGSAELMERLEEIREDYLQASGEDKEILKKQFIDTQNEILKNELKSTGKNQSKRAVMLSAWSPFEDQATGWFDPEWMFGVDGFHIIIANPPYVGQKGNKEMFQEIKDSYFGKKFHQRRMDLFYFFFHIAIHYSLDKGIISFITTNYYPTATYSDKLREDLFKNTTPLIFVNFNELKIFPSAAGQHNMISIFQKNGTNDECKIIHVDQEGDATTNDLNKILASKSDTSRSFKKEISEIFEPNTLYLRLHSSKEQSARGQVLNVLEKIKNVGVRLENYFNVEQGIVSGADKISNYLLKKYPALEAQKNEGIYVLDNQEVDSLNLEQGVRDKFIKRTYKNSDIDKWHFEKPDELNVIYIKSEGAFPEYPKVIRDHLDRFKIILINRNIRRGNISIDEYEDFVAGNKDVSYVMNASSMRRGNYYCLSYPRNGKNTFEKPKIVNSRRSKSNIFALENEGYYEQSDIVVTTLKEGIENPFSIYYLLGLLNSRLYYHWFYFFGKRKGENLELYNKPIQEAQIKIPESVENYVISYLTKMIIFQKKRGTEFGLFEKLLNLSVCEVYLKDYMSEKKINVINSLNRDIKEVLSAESILNDSSVKNLIKAWGENNNEICDTVNAVYNGNFDVLNAILLTGSWNENE